MEIVLLLILLLLLCNFSLSLRHISHLSSEQSIGECVMLKGIDLYYLALLYRCADYHASLMHL